MVESYCFVKRKRVIRAGSILLESNKSFTVLTSPCQGSSSPQAVYQSSSESARYFLVHMPHRYSGSFVSFIFGPRSIEPIRVLRIKPPCIAGRGCKQAVFRLSFPAYTFVQARAKNKRSPFLASSSRSLHCPARLRTRSRSGARTASAASPRREQGRRSSRRCRCQPWHWGCQD